VQKDAIICGKGGCGMKNVLVNDDEAMLVDAIQSSSRRGATL